MIGGFIANSVNAAFDQTSFAHTETFENQTGVGPSPARMALVSFVTLVIVFTLILLLGQFLWNSVLVALVPAIKPAKSVWQIFGLAVLIALLHPGSCTCDV